MPKAPAKMPAKPTETIKPELLPVDLGGGDIRFIKRSDYARRTAELLSLKFKAEFKKDVITQALELLDSGATEVPGEPVEVYVKMFELVNEDYQAAVEKVEEDRLKLEEEKYNKEREEKEKKEEEESLYVAVKDSQASFSDLAASFDTGNMDRFIAKDGTTDEELFAALNSSFSMSEFTGWMIGDLVVELQKRGKDNVIAKISESKGHSLSHIYNNAKTSRAFPPDTRLPGVSFTIFREIANAKFTEEQKKGIPTLMEEVGEGKHTTQTIREAVNKLKGKEAEAKKAPEEDEKFVFIVVDPNADDIEKNLVNTVLGFPKDLYENGSIVINPKTVKQFSKNGFAKKLENRWIDLVEYKKANPGEAAKKNGKKKK